MKREVFFQVFKKKADGMLEGMLVPRPYDDFIEFFEFLNFLFQQLSQNFDLCILKLHTLNTLQILITE